MKKTLFLLSIAIVFITCKKTDEDPLPKGCMDNWASNYNPDALEDCCCEYIDLIRVRYKVTGTAGNQFFVTWDDGSDNTHQQTVSSGWEKEVDAYGWQYISAQNQEDDGYVKVEIYVRGNLWLTDTSGEPYGIAEAYGSL